MFNYAVIQDVIEKLVQVGMIRSAYNLAVDHSLVGTADNLLPMVEGAYTLDDSGRIK